VAHGSIPIPEKCRTYKDTHKQSVNAVAMAKTDDQKPNRSNPKAETHRQTRKLHTNEAICT